jgi:CheY-like chemotaxis protein/anti-sigma regulatory factor (Ser/Thr protein kinase)
MRLGANVPLLLEIPPAPIYADIDPEQLDQAVTNLVFNARDAMAGRTIGVIRVRLSATGNEVSISVEDDGPGIPAENVDKLFEPFFTTKRSGTGLGLAVVKQIVERHHGRIETENREGGGASFTISIPTRVQLAPPHEVPRPESVRGLRLLLVEDESDVAEGIRLLLQDVRANVRTAPDGAAAIRELEAEVPDVVLLDVGLPDIDGLQLFGQIRLRWPSLPIVFSTGHGDQARLDEVLRGPRVGHVIKPYGLDELLTAIVKSLT